jgi:hypothetical protein
MRIRFRWLLIPAGLVLAAISLLVATGAVATCPATLLGTERQLSGSKLCAVEFFLNRYQTLLGAMIALMAALYAVSPVWRQLRTILYDPIRCSSGSGLPSCPITN